MASTDDVVITYKDDEIASMTDSGEKTLKTAGKYCEDDITVSYAKSSSPSIDPATATPLMDGTAAVGTSVKYAREDHVHPSDTSRAPLASPSFTGTPTAPTATAGTDNTQIATTAFVNDAIDDWLGTFTVDANGRLVYTYDPNSIIQNVDNTLY